MRTLATGRLVLWLFLSSSALYGQAGTVEDVEFGDLARLTDKEIQVVMREVDFPDLAVSLLWATDDLKDKITGNMSGRVAATLASEIEYLGPMAREEILRVQGRILEQARELGRRGAIAWPPGTAIVERGPPRTVEDSWAPSLLALLGRPSLRLSYAEIAEVMCGLAEMSRRSGILTLEQISSRISDPQLRAGVRLAIDGTEPALTRSILGTELWSQTFYVQMRHAVIIGGLLAIQAGDNPAIINHKLSIIYASGTDGQQVTNPDLDILRERLLDMADQRRREGIYTLVDEAETEEDELLKAGLYLILDGTDPALVQDLLEARADVLLADYQLRRRMLIEGIVAIQMGLSPSEVRHRLGDLTRRAADAEGGAPAGM